MAFARVENNSDCQVMPLVHRSVLPIHPMQNDFYEIPVLNSWLVSLLPCQFSITVEEIVFIIKPVLLGAPLVLMRSINDTVLLNGSGCFEIPIKPVFTFILSIKKFFT